MLGRTEIWYDTVTTASRLRIATLAGRPITDIGCPERPGVHDPPAPGPRPPAGCTELSIDVLGKDLRSHPRPPGWRGRTPSAP